MSHTESPDFDRIEEMRPILAEAREDREEIKRLRAEIALHLAALNCYSDEQARLRAVIRQAHAALTKSSLTADERVCDATAVLSRELFKVT